MNRDELELARIRLAAGALAGMLAGTPPESTIPPEDYAHDALMYADAVLTRHRDDVADRGWPRNFVDLDGHP